MVKIDQAFVNSVESTGADPSFLQAIIRLTRATGELRVREPPL